MAEEKRTVAQIIIENFLKDVEEKGTMPWQRPYERYDSFNYFSMKAYRGINRLLLPGGEYITKNQINTYNKEHGTDYRFAKGIRWLPVIFFKPDKKKISAEELHKVFPDVIVGGDQEIHLHKDGWSYIVRGNLIIKQRNILRYYLVAERKYFVNSQGECLPSRIESGEVVITKQKPQEVFNSYLERSGVNVETTNSTPCYYPSLDTVMLNAHTKSEDAWFSTAFHELAHSTGHKSRLCREGVVKSATFGSDTYAVEECIAEITACLCCAETGISNMKTSGMAEYDNSIAYVQSWKKRVKDWGSRFIYIVSQADKSFNMICNNPDGGIPSSDEEE